MPWYNVIQSIKRGGKMSELQSGQFGQQKAMRKHKPISFWMAIILGILLGVSVVFNIILTVALMGSFFSMSSTASVGKTQYHEVFIAGEADADDKILCIPVSGIIVKGRGSNLFGFSQQEDLVDRILNALKQAEDDLKIKAIIFKINSPGGGISACEQIHKEIIRFKEKRPDVFIIACMDAVAASGGYYISAPADRIVASPLTITGSIGVIMGLINIEGLYNKLGLKHMVFKSGDKKDMGSATRELTEEERKIFQGIIDEMYQRFVKVVDEGRKNLDKSKILELADGRVYTGTQALQNGLIDELGDFKDTIEITKKMANLTQARVIKYKKRWTFFEFMEMASQYFSPRADIATQISEFTLEKHTPRFLYLWTME